MSNLIIIPPPGSYA